jgi:hypothetical protein
MPKVTDTAEKADPVRRMSKNSRLVDSAPPDRRLIIEKGGYSPDLGGATLPPTRRSITNPSQPKH